jgi:SAM-dependent methyltransferase
MTETQADLQAQINTYWNWRSGAGEPAAMVVHTDRERDVWQAALARFLPPPPAHVVDVGTGQGFLALLFADMGYRVTGFDLSDGMISVARGNAEGMANPPDFRLGDAMDPPLDASSVDVLTNRNVLWTLLDPARAFRNWFGVLRPGGRLLVLHGVPTPQEATTEPNLGQKARSDAAYSDALQQQLPGIRNRPTLDPVLGHVPAAGFIDVNVTRLEAIEEFERSERQPPRDRIWLALIATRPASG